MIRIIVELNFFKIYINDLLHLLVKRVDLLGLQFYINNSKSFKIEYLFKDGTVLESEYDSREKWVAILKELDKVDIF